MLKKRRLSGGFFLTFSTAFIEKNQGTNKIWNMFEKGVYANQEILVGFIVWDWT